MRPILRWMPTSETQRLPLKRSWSVVNLSPRCQTRRKQVQESSSPIRTCVGCRRRDVWERFVRFRLQPSGGRGAWICQGSLACVELAIRRGGFQRAFRSSPSPEWFEFLRRDLLDQGWV
ncbi:MAG: YlxR family protein [Acidimicrobiales bacterium]